MIKEQLWFRERGRLKYRRAQGVLFLPATFSDYLRGRHRQAVRTNVAHARNSGMTVECVSIPVWAPGPDDCRAGYLTPGPVERWMVIDAAGAMVADSVLTVDRETALLQGMVSTVSYARWLLHTAIVERLCGECTLLLTNSDDVPLLSSGNQHFQRLLGYSITRIRARRSWSELVSDVYVVRTVATGVRVVLLLGVCIALLALVTACGSVQTRSARPRTTAGARTAGTLTETGSTLLFPLMRTWAAAYHQQFPTVSISTAATGSGAGIAGASAGTADIGTSDAFLSSGDLVKNGTLLNIPLVISAQVVDYNLPGFGAGEHVKLDGGVLAGMYQGTITRWNDPAIAGLNPGVRLPNIAVVPLRRSDSSGDTFLFSSYLSTQDPAWNAAIGYGTTVAWPPVQLAVAEKGNSGMVSGCEATAGCVAYVGISYLSEGLANGLGEAGLATAGGQFVLPTATTVRAAVSSFVSATPPNETISMIDGPAVGGYPIVNYEYAIVSTAQRSSGTAQAMRAFLHWAITTGNTGSYLDPVRFQPLPAAVAVLAAEQIARIR